MKEFLLNSKIKTAPNGRGEHAGNLPSFPVGVFTFVDLLSLSVAVLTF